MAAFATWGNSVVEPDEGRVSARALFFRAQRGASHDGRDHGVRAREGGRASCGRRSSRSSFRLSAWLRRPRKLSHARAVTFVRSARSRTASGPARSRDRGNSRSCPKRQRRWISRRRAMLRCRHLRRRSARSFASVHLSCPCGVGGAITATTPYRIFSLTFLMPVSPANVRHIGRSIRRPIYTPKISKGRLFWAAYGAIKCADRYTELARGRFKDL
jgi:hypothetical protein